MDVRHLIGKVAGFPCMRGDEPDRHAYMLDFWSNCCIFVPYPLSVHAREGNCQPTLAVHYRRLSSTQACLKRTDFSGSSLCN